MSCPVYRGGGRLPAASSSHWSRPSASHEAHGRQIDFCRIKAVALLVLPALLRRWLPDGRQQGSEWVARNPRRADRTPGSFRINLHSGRWSDFATGDAGGDVISLLAYLFDYRQTEAARRLAVMLGVFIDE